jgi:hypothetical protein
MVSRSSPDGEDSGVAGNSGDHQGAEGRQQYFDLYRLAVDSAERATSARAAANGFFFTIQGVLAIVVGIAKPVGFLGVDKSPNKVGVLFLSAMGLLLSLTWLLLLRSYRALNSKKFKVILAMEEKLAYQIFAEEWKLLKEEPARKWRDRYAEQGTVEQFVPVLFMLMYLGLGIWVVVQ